MCALIVLTLAFTTDKSEHSIHKFTAKTIDGADFSFATLKGKKVMLVNTASECGYTNQYKELEELYLKYKNKNFIIIGFPCNDFGGQEPGTNSEIKSFCTKNYAVTFQMMDKITVKGPGAHPIYKWLCSKTENGVDDYEVKWNFNKFLIDENGKLVKHYLSRITPMDSEITNWIEGKK